MQLFRYDCLLRQTLGRGLNLRIYPIVFGGNILNWWLPPPPPKERERELKITYVLDSKLHISIVFNTLKRNKSLLMNTHCVLGVWEQRVHSKAMLGSSKRNDKIVSAQYSLNNSGANRWRLHLAKKPMGGDSPIQLQDASALSSSLNILS